MAEGHSPPNGFTRLAHRHAEIWRCGRYVFKRPAGSYRYDLYFIRHQVLRGLLEESLNRLRLYLPEMYYASPNGKTALCQEYVPHTVIDLSQDSSIKGNISTAYVLIRDVINSGIQPELSELPDHLRGVNLDALWVDVKPDLFNINKRPHNGNIVLRNDGRLCLLELTT